MRNDTQARFRIDSVTWAEFQELASRRDMTASQMLRAYVRQKVEESSAGGRAHRTGDISRGN